MTFDDWILGQTSFLYIVSHLQPLPSCWIVASPELAIDRWTLVGWLARLGTATIEKQQ